MAHRNQKSFAPAFAGFAMAALLGPICWSNQGASVSGSQGSAEVLHLRTDGLPTPLVIAGDPLKRSVTSLEIRGSVNLKDLPQLRGLSFNCCRGITDEGVAHLAGLKNLKSLQRHAGGQGGAESRSPVLSIGE